MKSTSGIERLAQGLTIVSFVTICWVTSRTLQTRTQCVNSTFLSFVQIGKQRIDNCIFESRLSLDQIFHPLSVEQKGMVQSLEVLERLAGLFQSAEPHVAVEVNLDEPHLFELGRGYLRLGREWLQDPLQTKRALVMAVLKREQPENYANPFQLEVMTDFLLLTVLGEQNWQGHSIILEAKFPTSSPSFSLYCKSPFRSLAHYEACAGPRPDTDDIQNHVWGFRSLLAVALWRLYERAPLVDKLRTLATIRDARRMPAVSGLRESSIETKVLWFESTLKDQMDALKLGDRGGWGLKRTLKELEVEAPTRWELTVDITNTPVWKEILEQFKTWSRLHPQERTLIFTPQGAVAFPSGIPVAWNAAEVQSQKHVLIACTWPKAEEMLTIKARHMYAQQSCAKVGDVFWN